ncbi:MAG: glycoside hydrolase family 20 zincin-like fold domain-containing protein, partial [Armatimonadota bacterium]
MARLSITFAIFFLASMAFGEDLYLLPKPASVELHGGTFKIPQQIRIRASSQGEKIVRTILMDQGKERISTQIIRAKGWVALIGEVSLPPCPDGPESYRLHVKAKGIALTAPTAEGYRHGIRTLAQLLMSSAKTTLSQKSAYEGVSVAEISRPAAGTIPCCTIEDHPALGVRGLMIDMVRLKEKDETYFRLLEEIATWKMNALFLHFTDHQGCSIE